jgi:hypothetical protein
VKFTAHTSRVITLTAVWPFTEFKQCLEVMYKVFKVCFNMESEQGAFYIIITNINKGRKYKY